MWNKRDSFITFAKSIRTKWNSSLKVTDLVFYTDKLFIFRMLY